jgi:mono/diheme cytochrome c family protein
VRRGRAVFADTCAGCHTLTGRDTSIRGGDLAVVELSVADIESFIRVMPVRLTRADARAVAAYVHHVEVRGGIG